MIKPAGLAILITLIPLQIAGVVCLFRMYRQHRRFYRAAVVTTGQVVATRKYSGDEGPSFYARIAYSVAAMSYEIKVWRRYQRGHEVRVYYLPNAPEKGRLADPFAPAIFIGGSLLLSATCAISVCALLSTR